MVFRLILAALVLHLVLIQPNHPAAMTWGALLLFPLELPVILLALVALPQRPWVRGLRGVLVAVLILIVLQKAADYGMFVALGRGFNPVADLPLIDAALRLTTGALGAWAAIAAVIAAVIAVAGLSALLWWATGVWARVTLPRNLARASGVAACLAGAFAVGEIGHTMRSWALPINPPGAAFTARLAVERVALATTTIEELRIFKDMAQNDPYTDVDGLFDRIDRDVLVVFVESYGRASFDTPLYADLHRETLANGAQRLANLGLATRSGFIAAPTRGGQSWLSHSTFANGLWINDQTRYRAALISGRETLFHLAARSEFRTAAVMPQITLAWPESDFMGFETILAAADLGYEGEPFNWVTMPDQFTLGALDRLLRDVPAERPLFAQVALSSSHAPWVPVPDLIAWEDLGNGTVFNDMALAGDPPDVVWRDHDRVRAQYRLSIDYSLQTVIDYAARHADDPPLIIMLGDHQSAGFVAQNETPDVAMHVIGPPALVDLVADWGWPRGMIPDANVPVFSMDTMRNRILNTFSTAPLKAVAG